MQTSRLDERQTVVGLMSRGVDKQPLRSPVGVLSTGGAYSNFALCSWHIAAERKQRDARVHQLCN